MKNKVRVILSLWLFTYMFESPLRYYLGLLGYPQLIYLNKILLLIIIASGTINILNSLKLNKAIFFIIILMVIGLIVGLINGLALKQILFSINIFLPFFAFYFAVNYYGVNKEYFEFLYRFSIPIIVLGLVLDKLYILPWQNSVYEIAGHVVQANRYWTMNGVERLAGFQRSSFSSAYLLSALIIIRFIIYTYYQELSKQNVLKKIYDFIVLILGGYGIYLTTSKTAYFSIIMFFILYVMLKVFYSISFKQGRVFIQIFFKFFMMFLLFYGLIPPFYTSIVNTNLSSTHSISIDLLNLVFSSYLDRVFNTWPNALNLLNDSYFSIFGRGLGGIGTPQMYFELDKYNPADNFFIYILITCGYLIIPIIIYFVMKTLFLDLEKRKSIFLVGVMFSIFSFGATMNFVESAELLMLSGVLLGLYFKESH
ncbi:hypothetical protein [Bacillus methanolicus]|uniref:Putative membrane protein n=1 Tax=Bacillus methanolicus (strain MGA3 / ATCC 53907) TaxID=796606 RepID=I3EBA5_BACMM|nr:hypothetical protein [Bacillus methanolicus]AIE61457.1 putative membrane protein [Bacillus methanolicus MGA3]EIJ83776.1 hypothetical protein MGA3_00705 [Bacillus methanolicus MGA3]